MTQIPTFDEYLHRKNRKQKKLSRKFYWSKIKKFYQIFNKKGLSIK